jgi:hypothetical protein
MQKNLCETVIYSDKCGKTAVRETEDAEINNVIYMELHLGAKMVDGKYRKTYVVGSVDREKTVLSGYCLFFSAGVSEEQHKFNH